MHLRNTQRHARLTAWLLNTPRSRQALLLLRVTMLAILCGALPAAAQVRPASNDPQPALILNEGCCYIPPDSPLANQSISAPKPAPQAGATLPAGLPGTSARIAPPPPAPVTTMSAVNVPTNASPSLNTETEDEMEDRGTFIDTLKGVLDGRSPSQGPTSANTVLVSTHTHPGHAADVEQRIARVTASPAWKSLEVLSLAFALGIGAAAAYFYTRRGSGMSD